MNCFSRISHKKLLEANVLLEACRLINFSFLFFSALWVFVRLPFNVSFIRFQLSFMNELFCFSTLVMVIDSSSKTQTLRWSNANWKKVLPESIHESLLKVLRVKNIQFPGLFPEEKKLHIADLRKVFIFLSSALRSSIPQHDHDDIDIFPEELLFWVNTPSYIVEWKPTKEINVKFR